MPGVDLADRPLERRPVRPDRSSCRRSLGPFNLGNVVVRSTNASTIDAALTVTRTRSPVSRAPARLRANVRSNAGFIFNPTSCASSTSPRRSAAPAQQVSAPSLYRSPDYIRTTFSAHLGTLVANGASLDAKLTSPGPQSNIAHVKVAASTPLRLTTLQKACLHRVRRESSLAHLSIGVARRAAHTPFR